MTDVAFDLSGKKVFVAGHRGMAGSAIMRRLKSERCEILTADRRLVDLTRQDATQAYLSDIKPDVVIMAAGRVGGIKANSSYPADFIAQNLSMALNVIVGSHDVGVQKLLFLGSTCIYPKFAHQPISEDELLTGPLEETNEWYAIAKIAGIKLCQALRKQHGADFISAMPTNLFGPGDNYHPEDSHVVAALIRRFHAAKYDKASTVIVWGTGLPRREFLFVDDLADACIFLLRHYSDDKIVNVGVGKDMTIAELAIIIGEIVEYQGEIIFDSTKPDGTPRKLVDVSKINGLGWAARTTLRDGLARSYQDFLARNS